MYSYSHVNADYRAAPFAVSTNAKVRGTHTIAWLRRETGGHRCTFAIGRSIDPIGRPIDRFVTLLALGDRSDIVTRVITFRHTIMHRELSICGTWLSLSLGFNVEKFISSLITSGKLSIEMYIR